MSFHVIQYFTITSPKMKQWQNALHQHKFCYVFLLARFFTTIITICVTNMMFLLHLPLNALICPGKQSQLPWKMKLRTYKLLLLLDSSDRNPILVCSQIHQMCYTLSRYLDVLAPKSQHDLEIRTRYHLSFKYWHAYKYVRQI